MLLFDFDVFFFLLLLLDRLRKRNVETPYTVHISLLEGHVSPSPGQSTVMASMIAERWYMAPGVRRIEIFQNGIVGTLFLPPGEHLMHLNNLEMDLCKFFMRFSLLR